MAAQRAYVDTLSEALGAPSKLHSPVRVGDVVKKNEVSLTVLGSRLGISCVSTSVHATGHIGGER